MTKDKIQAFTLRITNANKTEMLAILYDMGIEYLKDSVECLESKDYESYSVELNKFRGVLRELMNSVNNDNEVGRVFLELYIYMSCEVTRALINRDKEPLNRIMGMLEKMSEAYARAAKGDTSGPVMEHTESVYSGLTYNRNSMAENVNNRDLSRGFLA